MIYKCFRIFHNVTIRHPPDMFSRSSPGTPAPHAHPARSSYVARWRFAPPPYVLPLGNPSTHQPSINQLHQWLQQQKSTMKIIKKSLGKMEVSAKSWCEPLLDPQLLDSIKQPTTWPSFYSTQGFQHRRKPSNLAIILFSTARITQICQRRTLLTQLSCDIAILH